MYCEKCGSKMKKGSEICYNCGNVRKSNINKYLINEENLPDEYKPITMWGYFGYQVLFAIPILGWIILIVIALGGVTNINLRNFARSYFCLWIILIIFLLLLWILK